MAVCSLFITVGSIVGINGLQEDLGSAVVGYQQLHEMYDMGFQVAAAKQALSASPADRARALLAIDGAILKLDAPSPTASSQVDGFDQMHRDACRLRLQRASALLNSAHVDDVLWAQQALTELNAVLGEFATLSSEIRVDITQKQLRAEQRRHRTLILISSLAIGLIVIAAVAGIWLYRSIVRPLDHLGQRVREFASGKFSTRISPTGDREFAVLADDFNWMAAELESLYRDLEDKVEAKSRLLVRSAQLASVGYLAAGVAHEINNPLSIITGYSERLLSLLDKADADVALRDRTRQSMKIICEEAFRCKEITDRLLSLARPGSADQQLISLVPLAQQVIRNLTGLPEYAKRRIELVANTQQDDVVLGKEGEMKQVILNLLINAIEAVDPQTGEIEVRTAREDDLVELAVIDNGAGMTAQTLERVFEPFFTQKSAARPGMGLGLSITHAIVAGYGGSITAQSDGPGLGSQFTVRLPAAQKGAVHAGR